MKKTVIRTAAAIIAATGLIMPFAGANAWEIKPVASRIPVIEPIPGIGDKITANLKTDIEFTSEEMSIDGDIERGCNFFITLTIRNSGPQTVRNIMVVFHVEEFRIDPNLNDTRAPEKLIYSISLAPYESRRLEYRLSSKVWSEDDFTFSNYHYSAEIFNVDNIDSDLSNNRIVRPVDRTSGTESL